MIQVAICKSCGFEWDHINQHGISHSPIHPVADYSTGKRDGWTIETKCRRCGGHFEITKRLNYEKLTDIEILKVVGNDVFVRDLNTFEEFTLSAPLVLKHLLEQGDINTVMNVRLKEYKQSGSTRTTWRIQK